MGKSSTALAVYLLIYYGIIDAHLVDIHIENPGEEMTRDNDRDRQRREQDSKTIDDPNASEKDKQEAFDRMAGNYEIA